MRVPARAAGSGGLFQPSFDEEASDRGPDNAVRLWREPWQTELRLRPDIIAPAQIRALLEDYRPERVLLHESEVREFGLAELLAEHCEPLPEHPDLHRLRREARAAPRP